MASATRPTSRPLAASVISSPSSWPRQRRRPKKARDPGQGGPRALTREESREWGEDRDPDRLACEDREKLRRQNPRKLRVNDLLTTVVEGAQGPRERLKLSSQATDGGSHVSRRDPKAALG